MAPPLWVIRPRISALVSNAKNENRVLPCPFRLSALADWSPELRLLQASGGLATGAPQSAHVRSGGVSLASGGWARSGRNLWPEAARPAAAVPGGPVEGG